MSELMKSEKGCLFLEMKVLRYMVSFGGFLSASYYVLFLEPLEDKTKQNKRILQPETVVVRDSRSLFNPRRHVELRTRKSTFKASRVP